MDWSKLWNEFLNGNAYAVEAVGTWATVVVAIVGAYFVWRQIRESRRLTVEQAQPDVVAMMESNPSQPQMIELAFKNFGATPARNITIASDIPIQRSKNDTNAEDVWLPSDLPYLAPGQEWRTTWDFAPRRMESVLKSADRHTITVSFDGLPKTKRRSTTAVLDWGAFTGRRFLDQKSTHHAAKALLGIEANLKKLTEHGKHLRVVIRDGDKLDAEERAEYQAYLAAVEAENEREAAALDRSDDQLPADAEPEGMTDPAM